MRDYVYRGDFTKKFGTQVWTFTYELLKDNKHGNYHVVKETSPFGFKLERDVYFKSYESMYELID